MITKVSCVNQNFCAVGFPNGRAVAMRTKNSKPIQNISRTGLIQYLRQADCHRTTFWGFCAGVAVAFSLAIATKSNAATNLLMHGAGMGTGLLAGKKLHNLIDSLR